MRLRGDGGRGGCCSAQDLLQRGEAITDKLLFTLERQWRESVCVGGREGEKVGDQEVRWNKRKEGREGR